MGSALACARRVGALSLPVVAEKGGSVSRPDSQVHHSFPRTDRLTSRRQFRAVYDQGRRVRGTYVTVFGLPNRLEHCRVGITVTRKSGGAVERNRVKRRLREIFRLNRLREAGSMDLVINAHPQFGRAAAPEVERDVLHCVRRLVRGAAR